MFLHPQPTDQELERLYDTTYYGEERKKFSASLEAAIELLTRVKWNRLRPMLTRGERILDVGCGRGTLLSLARRSGVEAVGIERPSPVGHAVEGVLYKSLEECRFPDEHFQMVILWHVLEHLPEPVATLREIHRILKPGGWLSIAVPNYGGAQALASGADWFHLDLPRHFWHFRMDALARMLAACGFRVEHRSTLSLEYDWFGTVQSWMNTALNDQNHLYSILKGSSNRNIVVDAVELTLAATLALPALAAALWDAARAQGGTITLGARRES